MDQQEAQEAKYRSEGEGGEIPREDPFPRMILVCIGITVVLLFIILGCILVDFVILRPDQNVRQPAAIEAVAPPEPAAHSEDGNN